MSENENNSFFRIIERAKKYEDCERFVAQMLEYDEMNYWFYDMYGRDEDDCFEINSFEAIRDDMEKYYREIWEYAHKSGG